MGLAIRCTDTVELAPMAGLRVEREMRAQFIARLQNRPADAIEARFAAGHTAWIAWLHDEPAAWGWVATHSADIGELGLTFAIPPRERYLWNFVTLRAFRGRGIYPRLLDGIVRAEAAHADRFWIAYAPENKASETGIRRAGFEPAATLSFDASGRPAMDGTGEHAAAAAAMLGLSLAHSLAACWRCVRAGKSAAMACAEGQCACDYQVAASGCA